MVLAEEQTVPQGELKATAPKATEVTERESQRHPAKRRQTHENKLINQPTRNVRRNCGFRTVLSVSGCTLGFSCAGQTHPPSPFRHPTQAFFWFGLAGLFDFSFGYWKVLADFSEVFQHCYAFLLDYVD